MKKLQLQLEELTCPSCLAKIEGALKNVNGVDNDSIEILFNSSKVKMEYDENIVDRDTIKNSITNIGYEVLR